MSRRAISLVALAGAFFLLLPPGFADRRPQRAPRPAPQRLSRPRPVHQAAAGALTRWIADAARSSHPDQGLLQVVHWGVADRKGVQVREDSGGPYLEVSVFRPNDSYSLERAADVLRRTVKSEARFSPFRNVRIETVDSAH